MKGVSVIGVGMIPFGKYPDKNIVDLGWPAVKAALKDAGIDGKRIEVTLTADSATAAETAVREMCDRLLANPVIEQFTFEVNEVAAAR
mgnify:CR=1 FL=1